MLNLKQHQISLLQAAFLQDLRASQAWADWLQSNQLDDIDFQSQQVLPQLYLNRSVNGAAEARVLGLHRRATYTNKLMLASVIAVVDRLSEQRVSVAAEKQTAGVLRAPGSYALNRVHLAVKHIDLPTTLTVLKQLDWTPARSNASDQTTTTAVLRGLDFGKAGAALTVRIQDAKDNTYWGCMQRVSFEGRTLAVPCATKQLLEACAPEFNWHAVTMMQRTLASLMVLRYSPDAPDWSVLLEMATNAELTLPLADVLECLNEEFSLDLPDGYLTALRNSAKSSIQVLEYRAKTGTQALWRRTAILLCDYRRMTQKRLALGPLDFLKSRWGFDDGVKVLRHMGHALLKDPGAKP